VIYLNTHARRLFFFSVAPLSFIPLVLATHEVGLFFRSRRAASSFLHLIFGSCRAASSFSRLILGSLCLASRHPPRHTRRHHRYGDRTLNL
jgi:hypothetical protein